MGSRSEAKGDVFTLVQHLDPSLNVGHVRQVLWRFVGIAPSYPEMARQPGPAGADRPVATGWERRPPLRPGSDAWTYLAQMRRLPAAVLTVAATADVVRDGPLASAWFAHRGADGTVCHVDIRGPDYKGSLRGGSKSLFKLPTGQGFPCRLVVTEAPIDALSLAALEGLRADTRYTATGGGIGPGTAAALQTELRAIAASPGARLIVATDADLAGDRHAARLAEIAAGAGVPSERLRPEIGDDWNNKGRGM